MRFSYLEFLVYPAEEGEPVTLFRPVVRLKVGGPTGIVELRALLDTGADYSVMPVDIARVCGIPLERDRQVTLQGIGGQETTAFIGSVSYELRGDCGETYRRDAEVVFAEEPTPLLGHPGFLEFIIATFNHQAKAIDLFPHEAP